MSRNLLVAGLLTCLLVNVFASEAPAHGPAHPAPAPAHPAPAPAHPAPAPAHPAPAPAHPAPAPAPAHPAPAPAPACTILKYRVQGTKMFQLSWQETNITISCEVLVRPHSRLWSSATIQMKNVQILIDRLHGHELSLRRCPSESISRVELERPFMANFNKDGVLQNIRVDKSDTELAINLKLYAATLMQVDTAQVIGQLAHSNRNELTVAGSCPTKSVIVKGGLDRGLVEVRKTLDMNHCTEVLHDRRGDKISCLGHTCRAAPERKTNWLGQSDIEIELVDKQPVIKKLVNSQEIQLLPWIHRDDELCMNARIVATLEAVINEDILPLGIGPHSMLINAPQYRKVRSDVCHPGHQWDLRRMYSGLICQQSAFLMYQDILEKGVLCHWPELH